MTITDFKPVSSDAMRGLCDVILPSGMVLHRCVVFVKGDRAWAAPPAKKSSAKTATVQYGVDGKSRSEQAVSFVDRPTQDCWSSAVIEALHAAHSEVLA